MIEAAAKATGRSVRKLAANAGMSDTRWRQVVKGWQPGPGGTKLEVHAPPMTLARMALVCGTVTSTDLREAGRADAADLLDRMGDEIEDLTGQALTADSGINLTQWVSDRRQILRRARAEGEPLVGPIDRGQPDEIDLIYASQMSAREKLLRIRQVLELRALADAEDAAQREAASVEKTEAADQESEEAQQG
jgi:hypothetical protein